MKQILFSAVLLLSQAINSQSFKKSEPFTHTFSIVARDLVTGEMGAAVQSHWFNVAFVVIHAEAGVGAVATQSLTNPIYGTKGLILMKQGLLPQKAVDALIADDEGEKFRQVAFINVKGEVATHTGSLCIDEA